MIDYFFNHVPGSLFFIGKICEHKSFIKYARARFCYLFDVNMKNIKSLR